jgi:hypothetical protein
VRSNHFIKQIVLVLLVFCFYKIKADASPKFSKSISIYFFDQQRPFLHVDSIAVIVHDGYNYSLAKLHYSTPDFWQGPTLDKEDKSYTLFTHQNIHSFKVIVFLGGQKYESAMLNRFPGNNIYHLEIQNKELEDVSPLFHDDPFKYSFSLFITLLLEVLLGLIFYSKYKLLRSLNFYLLSFIGINVLTHFLAWYMYSHVYVSILFLEALIFFIESFYWKLLLPVSYAKSFLYSFVTNIASWIIGGIVIFLVT